MRSSISLQTLLDAGLNAFGAELLGRPVEGRARYAVRDGFMLPIASVASFADDFARYLFTDGAGRPASRLVLEYDGRDLASRGGWGKEAVRDAVINRLARFLGEGWK